MPVNAGISASIIIKLILILNDGELFNIKQAIFKAFIDKVNHQFFLRKSIVMT